MWHATLDKVFALYHKSEASLIEREWLLSWLPGLLKSVYST